MRISSLLIGLASAFLVNGTKEMKMLNLSEDQNSSSSSSFDLSTEKTVMFNTMTQISTTTVEATIIPDTMTQFLSFLLSQSPAHQLYLLYDGDYKGLKYVHFISFP
ncbi:uncharacterized protein [Palaemon carinicauda]|uniref:uncharacterized protein isoform X1 n=1 Tax=Palaemon carinicauda TaxID=392227 RepID=UPI0035B64524